MRSALGVRVSDSGIAGAGKGLFAARAFPRWELVAPYDGEVISRAQLEARYPGDEIGAYALRYAGRPPQFVDGACERATAAIINAPAADAARNSNVSFLTTRQWGSRVPRARRAEMERDALSAHRHMVPGALPPRWRLWVVAKRDIVAGEELLADYGADYDLENAPAHSTRYYAPKRVPKVLQARLKESRRRLRHIA